MTAAAARALSRYVPSWPSVRTGGLNRYTKPGEIKFFDTDGVDFATPASNGYTISGNTILNIPQGTSPSQRIGRLAFIHSITVHMHMFVAQVNTNVDHVYKFYLMQDTQTNGAQASATDVFEGDNYDNFWNLDRVPRFRQLKKISGMFNPGNYNVGGSTYPVHGFYKEFTIKFKRPMKVDFTGTAGVVAERTRNSVFFMLASDETDQKLNVKMRVRVRYKD